jgi:hypothetical protein
LTIIKDTRRLHITKHQRYTSKTHITKKSKIHIKDTHHKNIKDTHHKNIKDTHHKNIKDTHHKNIKDTHHKNTSSQKHQRYTSSQKHQIEVKHTKTSKIHIIKQPIQIILVPARAQDAGGIGGSSPQKIDSLLPSPPLSPLSFVQ